jgi:transposase
MDVLHPRCAGLDVHQKTVVACARLVSAGAVTHEVRTFGATTRELLALAEWLAERRITDVAMVSTGVFWKPVWHVLDGQFALVLANARHLRYTPGRKSDVNDATWIADLLAHGLIRSSFVPPASIHELRDLTRTRKQLVREIAQHTLRLQKILEDANLKLTTVISDILGVSGRAILEALIAGEQDPERLAALTQGRLKAARPALVDALHGAVTHHRRFMLKLHLTQIDALETAVRELEARLGDALAPFQVAIQRLITMPGGEPHGGPRHRRGSRARYDPLSDGRPSGLLGGPMPPLARECRRAALHPNSTRGPLAQDHARPSRVGRRARQADLSARTVLAPEKPSRAEEGDPRRRRVHAYGELSHPQERGRLSRPRC